MASHFGFKLDSKEHPYGSPTTKYLKMIPKYAKYEMFFVKKRNIWWSLGKIYKIRPLSMQNIFFFGRSGRYLTPRGRSKKVN